MRAVIQRVRSTSVSVESRPASPSQDSASREVVRIGRGLLVLIGFSDQEDPGASARLAQRIVTLRIFDDEQGRLNRSLQDIHGELLLVPQVTLTARLAKGHRPSFHTAAAPEEARALFETFAQAVRAIYPKVSVGVFQSHMIVSLENDGPVTFVLDA